LVPHFRSEQRHSTLVPATFNLVATIVGGGVLSLPLAFEKCGGILPATALMLLTAVATDRSLYLLCLAARRSAGAATYGEVARQAFGKPAEWFVAGLLAVFLLFVVTAYMVLIRDIWTPLVVRRPVVAVSTVALLPPPPTTALQGNLVLLAGIVLLVPFLVQRELHALRYNCYVGFTSISILCAALCYRAWWTIRTTEADDKPPLEDDTGMAEAAPSTTTFSDVLFAFPIITLSFLSQFNILPIQSALKAPTRVRIQRVVHGAVAASGLLMYLFGVGGFLCFGAATQGNILLNLQDDHHWMVLAGRVGCGVTILLAMPMMLLPCRRNILELLDCWIEYRRNRQFAAAAHGVTEATALIPTTSTPVVHRSHSLEERIHLAEHAGAHYGSTFAILLVCYTAAVAAPGVAVVWSLCGSGMAFAIAFVLPAACFLRIQRKFSPSGVQSPAAWTALSWALLLGGALAAVVCTFQTTYLLIEPRRGRA